MSSADERKEVFAWFGAASYYAQCVEVELLLARLAMARDGDNDPSEAEWDRIEKEHHTMGGLLEFVCKGVSIEESEDRLLKECLHRRNYLAHNFWCERSHLLATSDGCQKAVIELKEMCDLFKLGNDVAEQISVRIRKQVGLSEAVVRRLQEEFVERLQAGEPQETVLQDQEAWLKRLRAGVADLKTQKPPQDDP